MLREAAKALELRREVVDEVLKQAQPTGMEDVRFIRNAGSRQMAEARTVIES
jgi:hypothetical protein